MRKIVLIILFACGFFLHAQKADAAIAVTDTSSNAGGASASYSWSHTTTVASNRLLIVSVSIRSLSPVRTVSTVTYGGNAMTLLGRTNASDVLGVEMWYLLNPPTGSNTVQVTIGGSSSLTSSVAAATSFSGVASSSTFGTFTPANGFSTTPTVSVSSATNEMVLDVVSIPNLTGDTATVGTNQTQRWNLWSSGDVRGLGSTEAGASNVTMSWTTKNEMWAIGAVGIRPYIDPPTVAVQAPSNLTSTSVTLNATANPNNNSTTGYFRYWPYSPGNCIDGGGVRIPIAGGTGLSGGVAQAFSQTVNGTLLPNKTYYYCAIASNVGGTSYFGNTATTPATFSTPQGPQSDCDGAPNSSITIGGTANCSFPGANNITGADGSSITLQSGAALTIQSGQTVVFQSLSKPGATINKITGGVMRKGYIWVKDADGDGRYDPSTVTYSTSAVTPPGAGYVRRNTLATSSYLSDAYDCNDSTSAVNTPDCKPGGVAVVGVTNQTGTAATLNASANPNGDAGTRGYFKWGPTNTGDCDSLASSTSATLISGTTPQNFSANISSLSQGSTYYWCTVVFNNSGTSYGPISSFDSYATPTVTTNAASSITNSTAQLNATINPNSSSTNRRYRYGTSNVACSSLGSVSSDVNIGSGSINVSPASVVIGVSANTTYYFCAEATNLGGTAQGSVLSFLSAPAIPTGVSATANSTTQITLNWTTQTGATNYQVLRCSGASCTPSNYTTDTAPTFIDTGLTCGTTYGYALQSINAGGNSSTSSVSYATTNACITAIGASPGNTNEFSDMVITSDGRPVITYKNTTTGWRVVKCADTTCTSISNDTAIANVSGAGGVPMAIMSNGFPILVFDGTSGLTAYKCSNQSCTAGTETVLVAGTNYGQWPDVVVPSDNNPVISFNNNTGGTAMVYKCSNSTCTAGSSTTIYSASASGANSKITLDSDGFPFVIYGIDNTGLAFTNCGNAACTSGNSNGIIENYTASSFPIYTAMTRGTDNLPFMIYAFASSGHAYSYTLRYTKCSVDANCITRLGGQIASSGDMPYHMAVAMGTDGNPVMVYGGATTVKVTKCNTSGCNGGGNVTTSVMTGTGSTPGAFNPAIAVNSSNIPFLVFINSVSPSGAKLQMCSNSSCN